MICTASLRIGRSSTQLLSLLGTLIVIMNCRPALFEETTHLIRKESIRIQLYNHIVTIGHLIITLKIKEGYKRVTERDISDYRERARLNREKRKLQNKSRSKTPITRPSEADGIVEVTLLYIFHFTLCDYFCGHRN